MLYIFLLLFIATPLYYAYNEDIAKQAINFSQSTYCVSNPNYWNCSTCDPFIKLDYVIENKGMRALQGYNSETDMIITAFRGSSDIQNWLDNIRVNQFSPYNDADIRVETGFYQEYNAVKYQLINNLPTLTKKYGTNQLFITGHSSGAAVSTLMAYDILTLYPEYNLGYLINFGSPRVGNHAFVDSFNSYNSTTYRITHYYDIVPHVPEQFFGYMHIANEIWYNEDNSDYTICDDLDNIEDNACSNSCAPFHCISTSDHLNYLNVTMGYNDAQSC